MLVWKVVLRGRWLFVFVLCAGHVCVVSVGVVNAAVACKGELFVCLRVLQVLVLCARVLAHVTGLCSCELV